MDTSSSSSSSSSLLTQRVALISRFTVEDFPFYSAWLEHYTNNIEIDHFYLFFIHHDEDAWNNTYKADFEKIISTATYHRLISEGRITIINGYRAYSDPDHFLQLIFPISTKKKSSVTEIEEEEEEKKANEFYSAMINKFDFVLHIDSDELLYLGKGITVHQFIRKIATKYSAKDLPVPNYFFFRWLMVPSREIFVEDYIKTLADQRNPKYFVDRGKSMASTKYIDWMKTACHHFDFLLPYESKKVIYNSNKEEDDDIRETTFLIHFSYRGIYDCLNKMRFQVFRYCRNNNHSQSFSNIFDRNFHDFRSDLFHPRIVVYLAELNCHEHIPTLAKMIDGAFGINGRRYLSSLGSASPSFAVAETNDILGLSKGIHSKSNFDYLTRISLLSVPNNKNEAIARDITINMIDCFVDRIEQMDALNIFQIEECGKINIKAFILNSVYNLKTVDKMISSVARNGNLIDRDILKSSISQKIQPTVMKEHRNFYLR